MSKKKVISFIALIIIVILWGITDNLSWHSTNYPLLFNSDYSKKPAYYAFLNAIDEVE